MNTLRLFAATLCLIYTIAPFSLAADRGAVDVIDTLHTTLLIVMKDGQKAGYRGRYDRLAPVIKASFDLPFIARTAVGRYWEAFDQAQRSRFVDAFTRLSIATYAANFDVYSGERFKVASEKEVAGGRIQVQTQFTKSDEGIVHLDYILHRVDNQWRIINVIADWVSDLALKRADYSAFLKDKGFDALLVKLNEKIAQYAR